jgi:hypothetical protein
VESERPAEERLRQAELRLSGGIQNAETELMKRVLVVALGLALAGLVLHAAEDKKGQAEPKKAPPLAKGLEKYDKNGDGKLDTAERETMRESRRKEFMAKWDKNGDGKLDEQELRSYRTEQQKLAETGKPNSPSKPEEKKKPAP